MVEIQCTRCKGTGKMEELTLSGIQDGRCSNKSCGVVYYGSTLTKRAQAHGGLCVECSGVYDGRRYRPQEPCTYCGVKYIQH